MSAVDVAGVLAMAQDREYNGFEPDNQSTHYHELTEARQAYADLLERSRSLEIAANGVGYCASKNPGRFAENLKFLSDAAAEYRVALAACGAKL